MFETLHLRRTVISSVASFILNIALVFVSYQLVIEQGGLAAVGIWAALRAWIFLIRLGDVGMANAVIRFSSRCDPHSQSGEIRRYVDTSLAMNAVLFSLLAVAGFFLFRANLELIFPGAPEAQRAAVVLLPLLFASFVLENLAGVASGALQGIHRGYAAAWVATIGTLAQLAVVIPLVPRLGLAGLAWGYFAQYALALLLAWGLFLYFSRKNGAPPQSILPLHVRWSAFREMLGYSLTAQVANLVNGVFEPLAKIVVSQFAGVAALGQFELAWRLVVMPRNAVATGVTATVPAATRLMATDRAAATDLYRRSKRLTWRIGLLVLGAVAVASPLVSYAWLGEWDRQFSLFTALFALGFLINLAGAPAYTLGAATGRMAANIAAAVLSVATMLLLSSLAGMLGSLTGMVAATAAGVALGGLYIRHHNEKLLSD